MFGAESYSGQRESKSVSGKVPNERFVNSCLANSPSVYLYTASNGRFLKPNKLQNHGNEGRGKEKKKSEEKERTRRKKTMVALLVFVIATLFEDSFWPKKTVGSKRSIW